MFPESHRTFPESQVEFLREFSVATRPLVALGTTDAEEQGDFDTSGVEKGMNDDECVLSLSQQLWSVQEKQYRNAEWKNHNADQQLTAQLDVEWQKKEEQRLGAEAEKWFAERKGKFSVETVEAVKSEFTDLLSRALLMADSAETAKLAEGVAYCETTIQADRQAFQLTPDSDRARKALAKMEIHAQLMGFLTKEDTYRVQKKYREVNVTVNKYILFIFYSYFIPKKYQ
jgi:multidrug efflux pump subunit AcrB